LRRKRTPLSELTWETVPWHSQPKTPKDELIDILIKVPGLLEDLDAARACHDQSVMRSLVCTLVDDCDSLDDQLHTWKTRMGYMLYTYDYDAVGLPLLDPVTDEDFALLHIVNVYWVVCLFLYSMKQFAEALISGSPVGSDSTPATTASTTSSSSSSSSQTQRDFASTVDIRTYPYKIAHSISLFFHLSGGPYSANMALFPLGLALRFLIAVEPIDVASDERELLTRSFNMPFMGTFLGRFLENLQLDAPDPQMQRIQGMEGRQARALRWWYRGNAPEKQLVSEFSHIYSGT
jgi:hypothetical protein